jgi:hypothetical protein
MKTLSTTPRPWYRWKAEDLSFLYVLLVWGFALTSLIIKKRQSLTFVLRYLLFLTERQKNRLGVKNNNQLKQLAIDKSLCLLGYNAPHRVRETRHQCQNLTHHTTNDDNIREEREFDVIDVMILFYPLRRNLNNPSCFSIPDMSRLCVVREHTKHMHGCNGIISSTQPHHRLSHPSHKVRNSKTTL